MDDFSGIDPSSMTPRLDNSPQAVDNNQVAMPAPQAAVTMPEAAPVVAAPPAMPTADLSAFYPDSPTVPEQQPISEDLNVPPVKSGGGAIKKILLVVVIIIVAGVLGGGGYMLGFTSGKTKGSNEAAAQFQADQAKQQEAATQKDDTADDSKSKSDDKLDLSTLQDPIYKDETVEGKVGEQVAAGDGFVLEVTKLERNFKTDDTNYKLDANSELVKVDFLMGNISKDQSKDISSFNFRLENSSGAQLIPETISEYDGKFDTTTLKPGSQAKGSIVYKVNKDEKPLKFTRTQAYRLTNQNKEVTTKISITVAS